MGAVYLAHDNSLGRDVALKVLHNGRDADPIVLSAIQQEAHVLASLNHPNICTVHEIGEQDGTLFIVMEYVDGRPLSEAAESGGLAYDAILNLARQLADGLAHAHDRHVVHRDLKSRNLVVTPEERLKILDFGLATVLTPGPAPYSSATTMTAMSDTDRGWLAGTLPYMAPELFLGQTADPRSDIWSVGVVLYEMLTGTPPFRGATAFDCSASILRDPLPPETRWPNRRFESVVRRCLAKSPADRYQHAGELRTALKLLDRPSRRERAALGTGRGESQRIGSASVAVLPFANLSTDPDQEYFCEGIADDIIVRLTRVRGLHVASRTSAFHFKEQAVDLKAIRQRLRVATVLEGSIRRNSDRLRVTATLVDTATGFHLWSEQFDRRIDDVFAVQNEISTAIADRLVIDLNPHADTTAPWSPTGNVQAYRLYLRGRFQFNSRRPELLQSAIEHFEQAIVADPHFALAYAGLADTLTLLAIHGPSPPTAVFPKAIAAAVHALELDAELGAAHASRGFTKAVYEWDWAGAEHHFRRALDLNPGDSNARHWYAIDCLMPQLRLDEALEQMERAIALDPLSVSINTSMGGLYHDRREYARAIDQYLSTIELEPRFYFAYWNLGRTYVQIAEYSKAMEAFDTTLRLSGRPAQVLAYMAHCHAMAGRHDDARRLLDELIQMRQKQFVHATGLAIVHVSLGEYDQAFQWLNTAVLERSVWVIWLKSAPIFDSVREDPRYGALLARVGLS